MNVLTARVVVLEESADGVLVGCELLVDDGLVAEREAAAISVSQLEASARGDGDFWILTCTCGEPGCAGLMSPIQIRHVGGAVTWEEDAPGSPARRFVVAPDGAAQPEDARPTVETSRRFEFDAGQYRSTIEALVRGLPAFATSVAQRTGRAVEIVPLGDEAMFGLVKDA